MFGTISHAQRVRSFLVLLFLSCAFTVYAQRFDESSLASMSPDHVPVRNWSVDSTWHPKSEGVDAIRTGLIGSPALFQGFGPCRIVDTRGSTGTYGGPSLTTTARDFPLQGTTGYACSDSTPSSGIVAYSLYITVVSPASQGYLTAWPKGQSVPGTSVLNFNAGQTIGSAAIVEAGTDGNITLAPSCGTDVIIDINGVFLSTLPCGFSQACNVSGPSFLITNSNSSGTSIRGTNSSSGTGVDGESASGVGVNAASSGSGTGLVVASNSGNLITGCSGACNSNVFRVSNNGNVYAAGYNTGGADVAESVTSIEKLQAGDVVEIDPRHPGLFRKTSTKGSRAVAGVISTSPGLTMNMKDAANAAAGGPQLALVGRVPVKVTAANGAIRAGDLLIASGDPGRAMRAGSSPAPGSVIGKALGNSQGKVGVIEMLVWGR